VIIPTLNEAEHLPMLLADLARQQQISLEIIIGDGGSTDATEAVATRLGARFVTAPRGRGAQMNAAVATASGTFLLFLHADSTLDDPLILNTALNTIMTETQKNSRCAGHFSLRFQRTSGRNALAYRYAEEKTAFNRPNTTNGDQGLLLNASFFNSLGGFDEKLPFLEDQRIAEKIRNIGTWITLPGCISTSARRFETEGFHRRYILMSMIMGLYSIGEEEFFVRAPAVYRTQHETGRLQLSPFFELILYLIRNVWGFSGTLNAFYRLGRYIRQNSWQMFYFLDVILRPLMGAGRYPCLRFHDQVFVPCTNFKVFNIMTGVLCFVWFLGVLKPYFRLVEGLERSSVPSR
jgi:rSAM/selenodomain-associated transferase 2